MSKFGIALICIAALGLMATAAQAKPRVTAFNRAQVMLYTRAGAPVSPTPVPVSQLPKPPFDIPEFGPANSVGVPYKGQVVFVRRLDVTTEGAVTQCVSVQTASRGADSQHAGERMGAGSSQNCAVGGH